MSSFIHADIFFFITTIVVICLAVALLILLIYAIASVRTLFRISKTIETETNNVVHDVETLRHDLHRRHARLKTRLMFLKRFFRRLFKS